MRYIRVLEHTTILSKSIYNIIHIFGFMKIDFFCFDFKNSNQ